MEKLCECGHAESEHVDADDLMSDPTALLNALKEIDVLLGKVDSEGRIRQSLDSVLSVCQKKDCTCRKYEPA